MRRSSSSFTAWERGGGKGGTAAPIVCRCGLFSHLGGRNGEVIMFQLLSVVATCRVCKGSSGFVGKSPRPRVQARLHALRFPFFVVLSVLGVASVASCGRP